MNPYYSGIGIGRALHGKKVAVYALTSERDAPGAKSRYFAGAYDVPNGRDAPQQLCERLIELREGRIQRPVLFPTRDLDVLFLHDYRELLSRHYILPQPDGTSILRMMDKLELANVATKIQIPVPQTSSCASSAELQALLPDMKFPVIIKPRFAYQWRRKGVWDAVGAQKAIIVESAEKLQTEYERLAQFTQEVLLQEYIAGDDRDIVVCGVYIDQAGNVQGHFTGRKLRQNPPLVGTGSIVEACEVDAIVAPSTALLKAFGYAGLAEIEYKLDKNNGKYRLIEINPRHWDQHELGNLVGVNLTWIAYQDLVGMTATKVTPNYGGAPTFRWIAETELLQAIVTNLYLQLRSLRNSKTRTRDYFRAVGRTIQDLSGLLRGKKVCGVLSLRDPVPSVLLCSRLLRNAFSFVGRRLRSA